ncbi:hypothetical protein L218DRAFT_1009125 [Marasmius fiardii PR-910]|nr:hypothetical protein L218DRAFT_1009125 [Marasmius fiardii PR-910]
MSILFTTNVQTRKQTQEAIRAVYRDLPYYSANPSPMATTTRGYSRHPSEDPKLLEKKDWTYNPTPLSEEEMLKSTFKQYEDLIMTYLYCKPVKGNVGVQKTLLQSLPKPGYYSGKDDLTYFDEWICTFVCWLNTADLCGDEARWSSSKQHLVLTSVDIQSKNAVAAFLKKSAWQWFSDVVEQVPDRDTEDPLRGQWTFMNVIGGLYKCFIHESSITKMAERYEAVTYSRERGAEGLSIP